MSFFSHATWGLDMFLLREATTANTRQKRIEQIAIVAVYAGIYALSRLWLSQVMEYVPQPYMDEIFHIRQADVYCRGEWHKWDPKITTPPGLYVVSVLLIKFIRGISCSVAELRGVDCLALLILLFAAQDCRKGITGAKRNIGTIFDWDNIHTALNICLFPPLFFFSGLYYTDVLSTCVVIQAYAHFLSKDKGPSSSLFRGLVTFASGIIALSMRQTNIFWVAIFMGGLEVTKTFEGKRSLAPDVDRQSLEDQVKNFSLASYHGSYHDPVLAEAGAFDFLLCATSLAIATVCNPRRVVSKLWPYVALLIAFGAFVFWNGGVVLGDKSNHVATIHVSQMLYIWPFMAFFSFPLFYPSVLGLLSTLQPPSIRSSFTVPGFRSTIQKFTIAWLLVGIAIATGVIYFNTIVHPFTLADNRHYVFYVFRYTILRHPVIKYALAPVYIICSFFLMRCLAGPSPGYRDEAVIGGKSTASASQRTTKRPIRRQAVTKSSLALIWLLSTILSLVTAPLVEPRYFIIPWIVWRLHVPALHIPSDTKGAAKQSTGQKNTKEDPSKSSWTLQAKYWAYDGHDHRLWIETTWFLFISLITGGIFLFKGFEWPQEPGRVQRFMW